MGVEDRIDDCLVRKRRKGARPLYRSDVSQGATGLLAQSDLLKAGYALRDIQSQDTIPCIRRREFALEMQMPRAGETGSLLPRGNPFSNGPGQLRRNRVLIYKRDSAILETESNPALLLLRQKLKRLE